MSHSAIRDLFFNVSLTKWVFSVPFTSLIASPVFTIWAIHSGIDIEVFENYINSHPGIALVVGFIFLSPFLLLSSYVYERWVLPKIKIRNWSEDGFVPVMIVMFFSFLYFLFIPVGTLVLFGLTTAS